MTRSEILIQKALDHGMDKDVETLKIIVELVAEYSIALNNALQLEGAIKAYMKEGERFLQELKDQENDRTKLI